MSRSEQYIDLDGRSWSLAALDVEERSLVRVLKARAKGDVHWNEFDNFWMSEVHSFYTSRGLTRQQTICTIPIVSAKTCAAALA